MKNIDKLEYHDSSLLEICFAFENERIDVIFENEKGTNKLIFNQVSSLSLGNIPSFSDFEEIEVYSAEFDKTDTITRVEFVFLLGFSKPSWKMSFCFENVHVE